MKSIFSGIHQIGIVVKNVNKTVMDFTNNYGIGPWNVWKFDSDMVQDMQVNGKRIDYSMMVATCKSGNVDWEIIEPLDNKTIFYQFYNKFGEGIQHINYISKDFYKTIDYLRKRDVKTIQYGNLVGKHIYIFFDTASDAKHVIEISTNLPGFKRKQPLWIYPENKQQLIPVFDRIEQIGIVVRDIIKTAKVLNEKYMIGPWKFYNIGSDTVSDMAIENIRQDYSYNIAICKIGGVALKLVEPKDQKTLFSKHLEKFGEGLHHVSFSVNDVNELINKLVQGGKKILLSGIWKKQQYFYLSAKDDFKFDVCFYEKS